jgi:hypothetical protein
MEMMSTTNTADMVAAAVGMNMRAAAEEQTRCAEQYGLSIDVVSSVFVNDGSKAWPSTLALTLCEHPDLAHGTRSDMAELITKCLALSKPFSPARLSRPLSAKAKILTVSILKRFAYNHTSVNTGLDIRDAVKAGVSAIGDVKHEIKTHFEADGVFLGNKWFPYERIRTYETGMPWYYLGLRFAGELIPLKAVLAMRDTGISQFIQLDEISQRVASPDRLERRTALMG